MSNIAAGTTSGTALVSTGNTSGELQLQVNGTTPSVTLAANGSIGVGSSPSYGTNGQLLTSSGTGSAPTWTTVSAGFTLGAPVASTSGTSITFTGIPAGVKQVVISFKGVSTNGTSAKVIRLGDAGGIETTGYISVGDSMVNGTSLITDGISINSTLASNIINGSVRLTLENSTLYQWVASGTLCINGGGTDSLVTSGEKALSAELDRISVTTVNGTDTFDAGEINIMYI